MTTGLWTLGHGKLVFADPRPEDGRDWREYSYGGVYPHAIFVKTMTRFLAGEHGACIR